MLDQFYSINNEYAIACEVLYMAQKEKKNKNSGIQEDVLSEISEGMNKNKDINILKKKMGEAEDRIKQLESSSSELSDKLLRSHAEFENYRKRVIKEREDIRINTRMDAVNTIIPVLDHFELALNAAKDAKNIEVVLEGMSMIKNEFEKALSSLGVEEINAVGEEFNPNIHEAVANEPSEEYGKDIVIKQWRSGYKFQNRLIRPASVVVSSGKEEEE